MSAPGGIWFSWGGGSAPRRGEGVWSVLAGSGPGESAPRRRQGGSGPQGSAPMGEGGLLSQHALRQTPL